mmetsp:Transcript_60981/g.70844  ORF Transcript_60981/g.70844 Transcript_60981/m.70844 type:complete len:103 (-) Transcript_60981:625-933(-)|eukprot:CAMPEP_0176447646 /NCGR_PEP_ID=MMETSP0127-20121128/25194_1 /TAXON_ID=938130 /ORGANISM="Platyophrya macrostoma, Strain WH" /LENGTH=102 /DNA_ID=CAMNT_0017834209 /DNA_START=69 /DNA_END=377 /DNA_ORIENTATION=+
MSASQKLDDVCLSESGRLSPTVAATVTTLKTSQSGADLDWVHSVEAVASPFVGKKQETPEKVLLDCCREDQPLNRFNPIAVQQFQGGIKRSVSTGNMSGFTA